MSVNTWWRPRLCGMKHVDSLDPHQKTLKRRRFPLPWSRAPRFTPCLPLRSRLIWTSCVWPLNQGGGRDPIVACRRTPRSRQTRLFLSHVKKSAKPSMRLNAGRIETPMIRTFARLILFGEGALRHVLKEYGTHYHHERNHQGRANELLMPLASQEPLGTTSIHSCERLGGLLKYYSRAAA